jgi:DNA polymerase-3 subunit epsilon
MKEHPIALDLERPLVIFDLETTGTDTQNDRIVEIACVKIHPSYTREHYHQRINPQQPIPKEATQIHGISDADVASCPTFLEITPMLSQFLQGCDIGGFNVEKFDLPLLMQEYNRVKAAPPQITGLVVDSYRIFLQKEPRDLTAAYAFYCGQTLENAHSALADASATADILLAQITRYTDLPRTVPALHAHLHPTQPNWVDKEGKVVWLNNQPVLSFGKHKNKSLQELSRTEPAYLRWVTTSNFSSEVVQIIQEALNGRFPQKQQD